MSITHIVAGVLAANIITLSFAYGCWRLKKNTDDRGALALLIGIGLFVALIAYAARQ